MRFITIGRCNVVFFMTLALIDSSGCRSSRVSGTYIAHDDNSVSMMQLIQTDNGQISGVVNSVEIQADGHTKTEQQKVSGVRDGGQITLTMGSLLSAVNIGGTSNGDTIKLQAVNKAGQVLSFEFARSSSSEFKAYADQLNAKAKEISSELNIKAQGIALSRALQNKSQDASQLIHRTEQWISNAEIHAAKIPNAEGYFKKLESNMQSLIDRERKTANPVDRSQLSVAVNQDDINGGLVDIQINQLWDMNIVDVGNDISDEFGKFGSGCADAGVFQKEGATSQSISEWERVCPQLLSERDKFDSTFRRIRDQRSQFMSFQTAAQTRRKDLVKQAEQLSN